MNTGPDDICARCRHFKMKEYPAYAALGMGRCYGYDKELTQPVNKFTALTTQACAKYIRVWDEARDAWIAKKLNKEAGTAAQETGPRESAPTT
jgi:hypothetical protein